MVPAPNDGGAIAPPDPWDPVVRLTHWAVVLAVLVNDVIVKPGGVVHVWVGWALMAVLILRFVWGLVGPRAARFSAFPPDPRATLSHLADVARGRGREYPSHTPAGAMMVYTLWALLVVVVLTGLVMTQGKTPIAIAEEKAAVAAGDWSVLVRDGDGDHDGAEKSDFVQEIHDVAANLILLLAILHVGGVAVESRLLKRSLVRPMIGPKPGPKPDPKSGPKPARSRSR